MSNPAIGTKSYLGIIEESEFNTPDATKSMQKLTNALYGESIMLDISAVSSEAMNDAGGVLDSRNNEYKVSGSFPVELTQNGMSLLFKLFSGSVATTAVGGKFVKKFRRGVPQSFSVMKAFLNVGQFQILNGLLLTGYKQSVSSNGMAQGSFDLMGSGQSSEATVNPYPTPTVFQHKAYSNMEAKLFDGGVQAKILSYNFDIKNGAFDQRVVGSPFSDYIGAGQGEVSGELVIQFRDYAYINKIKNETTTDMKLTFTNGDNYISFFFPACKFSGQAGATIQGKEGITLAVKFIGLIDQVVGSPTFGTDFEIEVCDDQATV